MAGEASGAAPRRSGVAPRWQLGILLAVLGALLLSAFPYFEQIRNANELPRLVQAMSLVDAHEWAIDGPSRRGLPLGPDVARSPADGRIYPNKPPGASVVGALAYVVARRGAEAPTLREFTWWARLFGGVLPVLVIAAVAWGRLRQVYEPLVAATAVVLVVLGSPLFSYARLFYGHALAAALLYVGVVTVERGQAKGRAAVVAGGGALAAAAIAVEYGAAFAGIPVAAMLLWPLVARRSDRATRHAAGKLAAAGLAGALIPVALLASYQRAVFGSLLATGYHHAANPEFAALHGQGLLGLGVPRWDNVVTHLLSPNTGLLVWSPLVIVGIAGLLRAARHRGPLSRAARVQLGVFVVILLMGLGLSFEGGWRVGPRYLVVALPMLILGVAEFLAHWRDHPRTVLAGLALGLFGVALSWSLLANSMAATIWPHIDPTNISEPFGAVLVPLWEHGFAVYGMPSWFIRGSSVALVLPVLLGLGLGLWTGGGVRPLAVLLPMVLGVGLGLMGLTQIVPHSVLAHPKTERNLMYIERVYEPRMRNGKRVPGPSKVLVPLEQGEAQGPR